MLNKLLENHDRDIKCFSSGLYVNGDDYLHLDNNFYIDYYFIYFFNLRYQSYKWVYDIKLENY